MIWLKRHDSISPGVDVNRVLILCLENPIMYLYTKVHQLSSTSSSEQMKQLEEEHHAEWIVSYRREKKPRKYFPKQKCGTRSR